MRYAKFAATVFSALPLLLFALAASATDYDFTADFNRLPVGSLYQQPEQSEVWDSPLITKQFNGDKSGKLFSIVSCPGGVSGNCLEYHYIKGSIGTQTGLGPQYGVGEEWQVKFPAANVVNTSYWWMFMPGFPFTSNLGKTSPAIVVGACKVRTNWYPFGQLGATPYQDRFRPYRGDYTNGDAGSQDGANQMPKWAIQTGVWYFIHEQFASGSNGWSKVWIKQPTDAAPVLYLNVGARQCGGVWPSGPMLLEGSTYFGGAGPTYSRWSAAWSPFDNDDYAVTRSIRVWTGTGN
jgi:hypothetical protein